MARIDDLIAHPVVEVETQYVDVPNHAVEKAWRESQVKLLRKYGQTISPVLEEQTRLVKLIKSGDPEGRLQPFGGTK